MRKTYKYRLVPNKTVEKKLHWVLARYRELYNAGLSERRDAYRMAGQSISYYDQQNDLPEIKAEIREEYQEIAALSNGAFIESPRHSRQGEKKLKKLQEALSRKKRGSHRRARAVKRVAKAHRKVRHQRQDFASAVDEYNTYVRFRRA